MGEVTAEHRQQVYLRDLYQCTASALPGQCSGHLDIGHIIGRGMGGSDLYDTPGWLLTQCRWHNGQIEDNTQTRALAELAGMHIPRNAVALHPDRACVRYPDGTWYWLNDDGTREELADVWLHPQAG